ncbi:MAG: glycosyltransferase family 2 protein, partial [Lentisphaerae bacterium]|nr:glycosyltransferase family 2 protein [Lentisphaerota bacterium]
MSVDLSVVIPTYNRAALLRRTLDSLLDQSADQASFEVIVVDDGSEDATGAVLEAAARRDPGRVRALSCAHALSGAARNAGIAAARGRLILSMDDDLVADRDLIRLHLEAHARHPAAEVAILGRVETGDAGVDLLDPDTRRVGGLPAGAGGEREVDAALFTTQNVSL